MGTCAHVHTSIFGHRPLIASPAVTCTPEMRGPADFRAAHATATAAQVLCAIHVVMGGSAVPDLVGIFAGHVYYFLEDVQQVRLKAPLFLSDALDAPAPGQRVAQQNRNAFGGHNWGAGGQRLGAG